MNIAAAARRQYRANQLSFAFFTRATIALQAKSPERKAERKPRMSGSAPTDDAPNSPPTTSRKVSPRIGTRTIRKENCAIASLFTPQMRPVEMVVPERAVLGKAINNTHESGAIGGISVLISDFLTDSDWKEAVDLMIQKRREVHLIQVLSRDEISPEILGKYTLRDPEDRELDYKSNFSKANLKAYREAYDYHQNELRSFCASRGVGLVTVCSDEPIERMLFDKAVSAEVIV